jgi:hypothetical protein
MRCAISGRSSRKSPCWWICTTRPPTRRTRPDLNQILRREFSTTSFTQHLRQSRRTEHSLRHMNAHRAVTCLKVRSHKTGSGFRRNDIVRLHTAPVSGHKEAAEFISWNSAATECSISGIRLLRIPHGDQVVVQFDIIDPPAGPRPPNARWRQRRARPPNRLQRCPAQAGRTTQHQRTGRWLP